ncbi:MAG: tripartite tricarboxylate transporter family receptor [Paucimonas sp.]|nr:tripartite tricarboxylate transporter family receptor [Paucimonas sp.]
MNAKRKPLLRRACGLLAVLSVVVAGAAQATSFPERPITIIVPFGAGGIVDVSARVLAEGMSAQLKQPVLVVNRTGAGGTIAGNAVATAKPDGYTLGFLTMSGGAPEPFRFVYPAPYTSNDLRPIAQVSVASTVLAVLADSPYKSIKDLADHARKTGVLQVATPGKQTLASMVLRRIAVKENVKIDDIPYPGDAGMVPALMSGVVAAAAPDISSLQGFVKTGRVRVLASFTEQRLEGFPNIPTAIELGYEMPYISALGLLGQKALPEEIVKKLESTVAAVMKEPRYLEKMRAISIQHSFLDNVAYKKVLERDRENVEAFFKEQGFLK